MKKSLAFITLLFCSSVALASSDVVFPISNQEIKPYPGEASFILNGPNGIHNEVPYKMTCRINNPNKEIVILQYSVSPYLVCDSRGGCGGQTLNAKPTGLMLHLDPGVNTLVATGFMTASYNPNTKLVLKNFDNTEAVVLQGCTASLE